jgi:phenol hydroxylase P0 protein
MRPILAGSLQSHSQANAPTRSMTHTPATAATAERQPADIRRKFVRIRQVRTDGLVCFEFAIGWPELFVDLMLPRAAFDDFCLHQQVQLLSD